MTILTAGIILASLPAYTQPEYLSNLFNSIIIFPDYFQFSKNILYTIAASIFIVGSLTFRRLESFLSLRPLIWLGSLSYSLYAIHLLILGSIVSYLFVKLNNYFAYNISALISFVALITVSLIVAWIFRKYIDKPSIRFSNDIGSKLAKK